MVVSRPQVVKIQNLLKTVDPKAFMTITEVQEVIGQGFTFYNSSNKNKPFFDE